MGIIANSSNNNNNNGNNGDLLIACKIIHEFIEIYKHAWKKGDSRQMYLIDAGLLSTLVRFSFHSARRPKGFTQYYGQVANKRLARKTFCQDEIVEIELKWIVSTLWVCVAGRGREGGGCWGWGWRMANDMRINRKTEHQQTTYTNST